MKLQIFFLIFSGLVDKGDYVRQLMCQRKISGFRYPEEKKMFDHNELISILTEHLSHYSFTDIRTDRKDLPLPNPIQWKKKDCNHTPDVTAILNNKLFIFEVETHQSIDDERTKDRWRLFSNYARERGCFFAVVVPRDCWKQAARRCKKVNIQIDIWTAG